MNWNRIEGFRRETDPSDDVADLTPCFCLARSTRSGRGPAHLSRQTTAHSYTIMGGSPIAEQAAVP